MDAIEFTTRATQHKRFVVQTAIPYTTTGIPPTNQSVHSPRFLPLHAGGETVS